MKVDKEEESLIESVMFIPHTPHGELRRRLSNMEAGLGLKGKVRYVEEMGKSMEDTLVRRDPWSGQGCGRPHCLPCRNKKGKYNSQGVLYEIVCPECKEQGRRTAYIGESARTAFDRGLQHLRAMEGGVDGHPLVDHYRVDHPDHPQVEGEMKVLRCEERNVYRQATEGYYISNFQGYKILNSRGDWGQNLPPILETEVSLDKKRKERGGGADPPPPPSPPEGGQDPPPTALSQPTKRRRFNVKTGGGMVKGGEMIA